MHNVSPPIPRRIANWRRPVPAALALLLTLLLLFSALATPASAAESRVLPQLQAWANAAPDTSQRVIVRRVERNRTADAAVTRAGGRIIRDLGDLDAFVALVPGRALNSLGRHPAIRSISPDAPMRTTNVIDSNRLATFYPATVNAPQLWSQGITGRGVGVAIIDTGINEKLNDFRDPITGNLRIINQKPIVSIKTSSSDKYGHGTHIAGIIGGNSCNRKENDLRCRYIGIAPAATLIDIKVTDDNGKSFVSDVVAAIEWVISNRVTYNIRIMNLSMVSSVAESYRTSILAAAVERAWFNGILVVVSAGNNGPDSMLYPPANDPFVITVGAADMMGTPDRADDRLAPWSSYGVTQDGHVKPDVVAPGRAVVSLLSESKARLAENRSQRIVDTHYLRLSGSSMAAPVVAGIAALAFQTRPEWTNDQVKWLLMNTAFKLGDPANPLPGQGAGLVDAAAVVQYSGVPAFANQGLIRSDLLVTTDGSTAYSSGNWSTGNWSTGNWSTVNWSTSVVDE